MTQMMMVVVVMVVVTSMIELAVLLLLGGWRLPADLGRRRSVRKQRHGNDFHHADRWRRSACVLYLQDVLLVCFGFVVLFGR